ncbi:hypothetical protein JMJ56_30590 [Belnapia sp. T18]|uniref:Uncharacterized protein n=1 Tax=Belnapia arida TaxID=2804533 RepID=A0ABS1UCB2_9PROT|nr:hypothetical protein [Belnapia arida]MBL6082325.1 hypothetical protein [Belnapia arida]
MPVLKIGERPVDFLRTAVEVVLYPIRNPCQHRLDKSVVVRPLLTACDDLKGDIDGALQLCKRLLEIEPLIRLEPLRQHDHRAPLQTSRLRRLEKTSGL